jgi:hypothetical protein
MHHYVGVFACQRKTLPRFAGIDFSIVGIQISRTDIGAEINRQNHQENSKEQLVPVFFHFDASKFICSESELYIGDA